MPHDPPVVYRRAVPWPGDRTGVDLQRRVRRADLGPPQLRHAWELRHRRDPPTVRIAESRPLIGPELDRVSILVDIPVVETAYEQGIRKAGLATISPVLNVMAFQEQAIGTARVGARAVALVQRALERPADRAAPAADREWSAMLILDHIDDTRVAAQPARRLAGQE